MTTSVPQLPIEIQKRIAGVALFGSTLNKQNKGLIPGFPSDRAKTWCNKSDGVCGGQLLGKSYQSEHTRIKINI
jgi:cutinase